MKVQRSLFCPCVLALALAQVSLGVHHPRQLTPSPSSASQPPATNTPQQPTNPSQQPSLTTTPNQPPTAITTTNIISTNIPSQVLPTIPTSLPVSVPSTTSGPSAPPPAPLPTLSEEATVTTGPDGGSTTVTVISGPETSTTSSALPTNTQTKEEDDGGGLSTGSIVGMSVAAGVAVIGIVGFFVWKFTRKRFSDFDDNEAIKWPELNSHSGNPDSLPLPPRDPGRAGFDTGSDADLSRVNSVSNYSTPDFGAGGPDPYAIPPLPHLNPNQPYRDDPSVPSGYYDPYHGPVPGTIENGGSEYHEAYPMVQLRPLGRASPAPDYQVGRQSPAHGLYAGRNSPAPQGMGRASPGPQTAYSTGRNSPGPNAVYDAYGAR